MYFNQERNNMKVKISDLLASSTTYVLDGQSQTALGNLLLQKTPIKQTFVIRRIVKKINEELQVFDETRITLCERYGEKKELSYEIPKENLEKFNQEFQELLSSEVELPFENKLVLDNVYVSNQDLGNLEWLIECE